jgi:hypothetical protein
VVTIVSHGGNHYYCCAFLNSFALIRGDHTVSNEIKIRNSFLSGFGLAFGCLVAIAVFIVGGCVLMVGSCATAVVGTARTAAHVMEEAAEPSKREGWAPSTPRDALEKPTESASTFELLSSLERDLERPIKNEVYFIEEPNKYDIAKHALSVKGDGGRWAQAKYYDNRLVAPRFKKGVSTEYTDDAYRAMVAQYTYNPRTDYEKLLFREDVLAGDVIAGAVGDLVRASDHFDNLDDLLAEEKALDAQETISTEAKPQNGRFDDAPDRLEEWRQKREQAKRDADAKSAEQAKIEEAKFRTWTSATGAFSTEAKLAGMANGTVTLIKRDGKSIKVPQDKLSDADREFIEKWRRERK